MTNTNSNNNRAWYLIYTKPKQERLAQENLTRQNYQTYLPLIHERKRRKNQLINVVEPMFSRYLFIHLNQHSDNWGPIRSTLGVINIVRFGMQPTTVPDDLVEAIQAKDNDNGFQTVPTKILTHGDKVRIAEGPMYGYEGTFIGKNSKERVTILLNIIGQATKVDLCEAQLERIS